MINIGIDIGSTTAKISVVKDEEILFEKYQRHLSKARQTALDLIEEAKHIIQDEEIQITISGSAGLGLAEKCDLPFVQEVYATSLIMKKNMPDVNVAIELGGEDAKVIFFDNGIDERMNGSCAGGTGAFIDQMAILLNMTNEQLDKASLEAKKIYPIASRCGVFAKSDIQPLLNQGASKQDVAASIYHAVVSQTISGLIRGKKISGKVAFFGGPLYYCEGLRRDFKKTLNLNDETAIFPEYGRFAVSRGAAIFSKKCSITKYDEIINKIKSSLLDKKTTFDYLQPLFKNQDEYDEFIHRHSVDNVNYIDIEKYYGDAYLGIDCGSTTTKIVLISNKKEILYSFYDSNKGNPVDIVRNELIHIRKLCGNRINIKASAVTGYGEDLIKNAFKVDVGLVETLAHYSAAKYFNPNVSFILDIGGQDIKCFKIKNGAIDSIMLNEACSSGCGSFIETFAKSMNYSIEEFSKKGLQAKSPVSLGSRCTVFMNSSVKQAQKDGASIEDISAGLSISVIKNALYKVIRITSFEQLGECVVVQGGTFLNDAILRAFEQETSLNVIRPSIAGLMGAFGAALSVFDIKQSSLMSLDELENFKHSSTSSVCQGCSNHCHLTINTFNDNRKYISGNQCQKIINSDSYQELPNIYKYKKQLLSDLKPVKGKRGRIGMPLVLSMYELGPLWYKLFSELGYEVIFSGFSNRNLYEQGQFSIPSDTICYPAKLMHGHVMKLINDQIQTIFYPCLTMNIDELASDNHYNCPIVAYYSETINGNVEEIKNVNFMFPYLYVDNKNNLLNGLLPEIKKLDNSISKKELKKAIDIAFDFYKDFRHKIAEEGKRVLQYAKENNKRCLVLAGRPYHVDPEVCHNIDALANELGFVVLSEDSVFELTDFQFVKVLDQWTLHSRLYRAAKYVTTQSNVELVQLVSFGCGVDAITTDEIRDILESSGKHYTQIKIDEVNNLGAIRIRLRSLLGAIEQGEKDAR